jgi:hypothetical protein
MVCILTCMTDLGHRYTDTGTACILVFVCIDMYFNCLKIILLHIFIVIIGVLHDSFHNVLPSQAMAQAKFNG